MFGLLFDLDRKYKIRIQFNKVSDESFSSVSLIKVGWMCIMKLDYATGFYNMSFFNINIETEEELTQDVLKKNEATFIHEFIHYLQDLVLPYNIRYSLSNVRWFFNILNSAHKMGSIHRPFSEWNNESSTLWIQFIRSIGDSRSIDSVFKIEDATSEFVITSGYDSNLHIQREHRVYEYMLPVFEDGKSTSISYNLGARDILEYIAYKIQLKNFPNSPPAPQLPYESIDLIFEKYGLSHISDDIRLCIAECCLYNDVPMHFLLNTLLGNDKFKKYLLDILLYGEIEEKAALIAAQGKEVLRLEQRISELAAGNAGSGQKDDGHNGTGADTGRNPGDIRGDAERRREEQHPKLPDGVPA